MNTKTKLKVKVKEIKKGGPVIVYRITNIDVLRRRVRITIKAVDKMIDYGF